MSDAITNVEIEDVLDSIRRLVAAGERPARSEAPERKRPAPLILTPALRVADPPQTPWQTPAQPPAGIAAEGRNGVSAAPVNGTPPGDGPANDRPANDSPANDSPASAPPAGPAAGPDSVPAPSEVQDPDRFAFAADWDVDTLLTEIMAATLPLAGHPRAPGAAQPGDAPEPAADPPADETDTAAEAGATPDTMPEPAAPADTPPETDAPEADRPAPQAGAAARDEMERTLAALEAAVTDTPPETAEPRPHRLNLVLAQETPDTPAPETAHREEPEDSAAERHKLSAPRFRILPGGMLPDEATAEELAPLPQTRPLGRAQQAEIDGPWTEQNLLDEEALRELVGQMVRQELRGVLGEHITRTIRQNVRKLVRREIHSILSSQDCDD